MSRFKSDKMQLLFGFKISRGMGGGEYDPPPFTLGLNSFILIESIYLCNQMTYKLLIFQFVNQGQL